MCWGFPQGQEEDFPWVFPVTPVSTSRSPERRGGEDAQRCCERPQEKQLTPGPRWARGLILTHPDLCQLLALTLQQNIISQNRFWEMWAKYYQKISDFFFFFPIWEQDIRHAVFLALQCPHSLGGPRSSSQRAVLSATLQVCSTGGGFSDRLGIFGSRSTSSFWDLGWHLLCLVRWF